MPTTAPISMSFAFAGGEIQFGTRIVIIGEPAELEAAGVQIPSTITQLILLILIVLPGLTYQYLRELWRGPAPGEIDVGQRILRAVITSIILDTFYIVAAGPELIMLARGRKPTGWHGLLEQPRLVGVVAFGLLIGVPALAAAGVSWFERRRLNARYRGVPTAWDYAFQDRKPCFVRARLKEGGWAGGWYGTQSYASSFPRAGELLLESAWRLAEDGRFEERTEYTAGLILRADDVDVLELLEPPNVSEAHTECENRDKAATE